MLRTEKANDSFSLISAFHVLPSLTDHRKLHLKWRWMSTSLAEQLFQQAKVFYYTGNDVKVSGEQPIHDPNVQSYDLVDLQADTQYVICLRVTRKKNGRTPRAIPISGNMNRKHYVNSETTTPDAVSRIRLKPSSEAYVAEMECRVAVTRLAHWSALISIFTGILIACLIALSIFLLVKRNHMKCGLAKRDSIPQNVHLLGSKQEKTEDVTRQIEKYSCPLHHHEKSKTVISTSTDANTINKGAKYTKLDSSTTTLIKPPHYSVAKAHAAARDASTPEVLSNSGSESNRWSSTSSNVDANSDNRRYHRHPRKPAAAKRTSSSTIPDQESSVDAQDRKGQPKRTVSFLVSDRRRSTTRESRATSNSYSPASQAVSVQVSEPHIRKQVVTAGVSLSGSPEVIVSPISDVSPAKTAQLKVDSKKSELGKEPDVPDSCVSKTTAFSIHEHRQPILLGPNLGDGEISATSSLMDSNGACEPRPVTTLDLCTVTGVELVDESKTGSELTNATSMRKPVGTDSSITSSYGNEDDEFHQVNPLPLTTRIPVQREISALLDDTDSSSFFYTQFVESL